MRSRRDLARAARRREAHATAVVGCALTLVMTAGPPEARAQEPPRTSITVEGASIWNTRNDVRIPPDTGTEFSITDVIGSGSSPAVRVEGTVDLSPRHGLRFAFAPIRISGRGVPSSPITFAGAEFAPISTEVEYQFDSYRATYRYRFYGGDTWQWKVGFTGFVRDARIALTQSGVAAEDTDVGFVALAHLSGEAALSPRWRLRLELDGAAAPQGRAVDLLTAIEYTPVRWMTLAAGYRTIEGGADVDTVYTFAWLNAILARTTIRF